MLIKRFKLIIGIIIPFLAIFLMSHNVSASTASVSSAYVDFWSSSSQTGQVQANVSLPWNTNIGGSANDRQSFYLNSISMTYPISALASDLSVFGRIVMRFQPAFTSGEDAYFCNVALNDITTSASGIQTSCTATVTYNFSDNSTYSTSYPIYFNYTLPSGDLAAYVDYTQLLPDVSLSNITATFAKTGNYDIYSVTNGYSLVLTTLVSDASYYITDSGGNVDISPLVNQNQTIISQNQQIISGQNQNTQSIISNQNQNTQSIINSLQSCHQSVNLFDGVFELGLINGSTGQNTSNSSYIRSKNYIAVDELTNYVFSSPSDFFTDVFIYEYKSDYSYNLTTNKRTTIGSYFTTNPGTAYLRFRPLPATTDTTLKFQLQKGTTVTVYEPYGEEVCKNFNEQYYDEQRQADQNITNQTGSDIPNSTNSQTTSLLGVISSFIGALTNINTNGTCQLTLPFPEFVGGDTVVNPCNGKDKAPAIVQVFSSLFLISIFVPLAWLLIRMIYKEIRSFTNG